MLRNDSRPEARRRFFVYECEGGCIHLVVDQVSVRLGREEWPSLARVVMETDQRLRQQGHAVAMPMNAVC